MASPSKGKDERDNPTIHFTGELKDWQPFKQAIRRLADRYDYTWVFDTGAALYDFYVSQNRDNTIFNEIDLLEGDPPHRVSERDPLCDKCIGAEAELTS